MNKIRWGILGTGMIASEFAAGLQMLPDAELYAVGSRDATRAARFAQRFSVPCHYDSYAALVSDPQVDVVYIATPHTKHKEDALLCLHAGKAVLCEKPFTVNAAEAREVIALARQRQLFCMEAMWMRFTPTVMRLQALLASGLIGEICQIQTSLGFRIAFDPTHRAFNPALGGGALLDLGVYAVSLVHQLLGKPEQIVSRVRMSPTGVDEMASIVLGYATGQQAVISTSLCTYLANDALIAGTKGQIHLAAPLYRPEALAVRLFQSRLQETFVQGSAGQSIVKGLREIQWLGNFYRKAKSTLRPFVSGQREGERHPCKGNGYQYEAAEVMNCLRAGLLESAVMSLHETLAVLETMDAIRCQWGLRYPHEVFQEGTAPRDTHDQRSAVAPREVHMIAVQDK